MRSRGKKITAKRFMITVSIVVGVALLLLIGASLYRAYSSKQSATIPASVADQLSFSPFVVPDSDTTFTAESYKVGGEADGVAVLSYVITSIDGRHSVTASQYSQPTEYSEIPEYKTQFLSNVAKQYATVQTSNGTLYLGRQPKQNNNQLAVLLERGLIVFLVPTTGDIDEATWRKLGDSLTIEKL